jgi:hypothetical protein
VILFLKMASGHSFRPDLVKQIRDAIRVGLSARHVPSLILETQGIPVCPSCHSAAVTECLHPSVALCWGWGLVASVPSRLQMGSLALREAGVPLLGLFSLNSLCGNSFGCAWRRVLRRLPMSTPLMPVREQAPQMVSVPLRWSRCPPDGLGARLHG